MAEPHGPFRRHAPKLVLSLVIAALFVWLFHRGGLPLLPGRDALATIRPGGVALYVALSTVAVWLRTFRWVYLLRPIAEVSTRRVLGIGFLGYSAIFFAPLRMGELVRPYLMALDGDVGFTEATGTALAERVIDGLIVSLVLFAGLLFAHPISPLPHHLGGLPVPVQAIPGAAYTALVLFGGAFAAMGLFYFARVLARRVVHAILDVVSVKLALWVTRQIERLADSLRFLSSRSGAWFLRDTTAYWLANSAAFWAALYACGIVATPAEVCLCVGVIGLGLLIPSGPGMFGTYQLASYAALAMFRPEEVVVTAGAAFVFLTYTVQLLSTLVSVGVGYWLMQGSRPKPS